MAKLKPKLAIKLIGIVLLIIVLRIPSLFEPYWYGDEGITLTVGQRWFLNELPYLHVYDNKPPLIYLLFGLATNLFAVKLMVSLWVVASVIAIYSLGKKMASSLGVQPPTKLALIASLVLSVTLSLPALEGNIANGEILLILPTILGAFLIYSHTNKPLPSWELLLAGATFAVASLLKFPAIFDILAILLFLTITEISQRQLLLKDYLLITAGFIIVWLPFGVYFALNDSFGPFIKAVFLNNFSYLQPGNKFLLANDKLIIKTLITAGVCLFLIKKASQMPKPTLFAYLWLLFALFAALLSGRPYTHYLIQTLPPLSLLIAIILVKETPQKWLELGRLILIMGLVFVIFQFKIWPTVGYYQNFLSYLLGSKSYSQYQTWFDPRTARLVALANFLVNENKPNDSLFVWGNEPDLYFLTKLKPATPFITAYHLLSVPQAKTTGLRQLQTTPPKFVVTINNISERYDELLTFIQNNYQPIFYYQEEAVIWQRMPQK